MCQLRHDPGLNSLGKPIPFPYGLYRHPFWHQPRHAQEIVGRSHKPGCQVRPTSPFIPGFAESSDGLHPSKNLFDPLSDPLTQRIPRMPGRPAINRRSPSPLHIGSDMRGDLAASQQGHKSFLIIGLIPSKVLGRIPFEPVVSAWLPPLLPRPCPLPV